MPDPMACDPHSLTRGERDIYQKGVLGDAEGGG